LHYISIVLVLVKVNVFSLFPITPYISMTDKQQGVIRLTVLSARGAPLKIMTSA